jgi:acetyl-CoA carboxylase carboxyl transferase subunit beta
MDARTLRDLVLDAGSWQTWDSPVAQRAVDDDYAANWRRRGEETGQDESIITGEGRCAAARCRRRGEFGFLPGSIGSLSRRAADRAVERANPRRGCRCWPRPVSGGTRMQEGTVAFLQMIGITAASPGTRRRAPYLCYLRNPTFGGVLASWGLTGHVTIAEPGPHRLPRARGCTRPSTASRSPRACRPRRTWPRTG